MAFIDRVVENPGRYTLTNVDTGVVLGVFDIARAEGEVYDPGTLLNANNLNAQTQLDSNVETIFTNAGMSVGTYQNEVSDALKFTADKIIAEQITLTPVSPFTLYGATPITAVKMGNVVTVNGVVKVTTNTALDATSKTVCILPEGWRPDNSVYALTQSSGTLFALLDVTNSGQVRLGRMRDVSNSSGSFSTATPSTWLPFTITFIASN